MTAYPAYSQLSSAPGGRLSRPEPEGKELIACFPWYDTGHIENDASNNYSVIACVFLTAVTFLPSHCLATIGGSLPSRCLATIGGFLPSRCLAAVGGFLPSCCLATIRGLLPSRCLATVGEIYRHTRALTHTQTATWYHEPTLFFQNKESKLKIQFVPHKKHITSRLQRPTG
jgi:hypothetical protein